MAASICKLEFSCHPSYPISVLPLKVESNTFDFNHNALLKDSLTDNTPLTFYPMPLYTKWSLSFQIITQTIRETGPDSLWLTMKKKQYHSLNLYANIKKFIISELECSVQESEGKHPRRKCFSVPVFPLAISLASLQLSYFYWNIKTAPRIFTDIWIRQALLTEFSKFTQISQTLRNSSL